MKLNMIMKESLFRKFKEDYTNAKSAKVNIDKSISEWNRLYYGKEKDNSNKRLLMKEVAKMIEYQKPNITEPFLSTNNPMKVAMAGNSATSSEIEKFVNQVFIGDINREEFINDLVDILLREGTVWTRTGWSREEKMKQVSRYKTMEEIIKEGVEPENIIQIDENLFQVTNNEIVAIKNHPNSRICRNENIFPDPTARQERELGFVIEKRYVTYYDVVSMGVFPKDKLNKLKDCILNNSGRSFDRGTLESDRDDEDIDYGVDLSKVSDDINRHKFQLIEYWGYHDIYNKDKKTSMVASWVDEYNLLLDISENPYPSGNIPYRRAVYSPRPFSLWGNSLAFFIGESQNVKNGITRAILDSAALANSGQKFITRGAVDYVNFQRLKKKERYVMVNKPDGIQDGKFNQIPGSIFNLMQMVNAESNQLAGTDGNMAIDSQNANKDNPTQMTLSQQKMVSIVRSVGGLLSKNAEEWLSMSEAFLDDEQIIELFSDDNNPNNDRTDINAFRNSNKTKVVVTVGTRVAKNQELHQLNMLMQQSKALGESVPKEMINSLVAKMYDLFDMHEEASALRNYRPEPTQEELFAQQLQMQNMQLENTKLQYEIAKIQSETGKNNADAQSRMIDSQYGARYKVAQANEKMAKTEAHQVDSALKPGQAMMAIREQIQKNAKGE